MKREAMFYEILNEKVHCYLCPHNCMIENGHFGRCNVRTAENRKLYTINFGEVTSASLDPIEKKPLMYFRPSTRIFSVGSFGCNFTCGFCQNYNISQYKANSEFLSEDDLLNIVMEMEDNTGLAFTYNEPGIWYEYVYSCAKKLKRRSPDKAVVLVTNGYISTEPLKELLPYVDAMNIDLKSFSHSYYSQLCGGSLQPVLKTIELAAGSCHVEITTLLVSGENDSLEEVEEIAGFIKSINPEIPLHLTRYFPRYKMNSAPTDIGFMIKAQETAEKYLNRVVLGNV
jgi:pyruvate formate lyase activating enzyme